MRTPTERSPWGSLGPTLIFSVRTQAPELGPWLQDSCLGKAVATFSCLLWAAASPGPLWSPHFVTISSEECTLGLSEPRLAPAVCSNRAGKGQQPLRPGSRYLPLQSWDFEVSASLLINKINPFLLEHWGDLRTFLPAGERAEPAG